MSHVCFAEHLFSHTQAFWFFPTGVNFTDEFILMKPPAVHIFCVSLLLSKLCDITEGVNSPSLGLFCHVNVPVSCLLLGTWAASASACHGSGPCEDLQQLVHIC